VTLAASRAEVRPRRFFLLGFVTGVVGFGGTLYWVVGVMVRYGGLPIWVAAPVGALLVMYLALYPATFAWLVGRAVRTSGFGVLWLAPFVWVALEWARSWVLGGFPWALLGASQATVLPVVQLASITGVYGLSLVVVLVSTALALLVLSRHRRDRSGAAAVAALLIVVTGAGTIRAARSELTRSGTVVRVGLVQGNIAQDEKWNPAYRDRILTQYLDLSRRVIDAGAELIIWPEAATPFFFDIEAALAEPIRRLAVSSRTAFLIGTDEFVRGEGGAPNQYFNSAVLVREDGRSSRSYRKMQLVPFGEYVPLKQLLFFVGPLVEAVSDFSAGEEPVVFDAGGHRLSTAICYEVVFPWIARAFVLNGSELLTTITNDAWFGQSSAPYQHFEQAALRAVEQGRYLVRAANTGISGAIDPYGRTLAATSLFETTALTVDVRLHDGRTIYSYTGDVVVWVSLAVMLGVIVRSGRRSPIIR
jgi:apolipoprotein N-acyltransferase